jgi:hypothetical protein
MSDSALNDFVKESLVAGASKQQIHEALRSAGWAEDEINGALRLYSDREFVAPIPVPKSQISASDAFLYLVMFGMLYISAYNIGGLVFDFINLALPDPVNDMPRQVIGRSIRFSIASIIVAFPIFILIAYRIAKTIQHDPVRRNSTIRKWLTYLTLVVAAFIIVGDLIFSIFNLLSGELTLRFLLKALTIGLIAGAIFCYYFWTMRVDDEALSQ